MQSCFLNRSNVTQPFKRGGDVIIHTLPDSLWVFFCVTSFKGTLGGKEQYRSHGKEEIPDFYV